MKSIIIFIFLMEKLEAIFSEIEMDDKGLTGIELKRRVLFLGHHISSRSQYPARDTCPSGHKPKPLSFKLSLIWEPTKLWLLWLLLITQEYKCLWFIYCTCYYSHSGSIPTRSCLFHASMTDAVTLTMFQADHTERALRHAVDICLPLHILQSLDACYTQESQAAASIFLTPTQDHCWSPT